MKTKLIFSTIAALIITMVIVSCKKTTTPADAPQETYSATPILPATADNYISSGNDHLAALGRVLFYDKKLSLNNSVACASCHQQSKAFCDNLQFSVGLESGRTSRNAPSIFAKNSRLFWDGRASSISDLALKPVQNHVEMGFTNLKDLEAKIASTSYYPELFAKAFGAGATVSQSKIQQALSEFLRNFSFSNNKFSKSGNSTAGLTASETLGKTLFFGKARCSGCHHIESTNFGGGVIFGDSLGSNGGGNTGYGETDESHNIGLDEVYTDNGIGAVQNDHTQDGNFMVPVLLNAEYTAPYMHDGRYKTLEEVVEHYNSGIKNHPNLDLRLRDIGVDNIDNLSPAQEEALLNKFDTNHDGDISTDEAMKIAPIKLGLSTGEKKALVDFLKTLSDPTIFTEKKFSNPFAVN